MAYFRKRGIDRAGGVNRPVFLNRPYAVDCSVNIKGSSDWQLDDTQKHRYANKSNKHDTREVNERRWKYMKVLNAENRFEFRAIS